MQEFINDFCYTLARIIEIEEKGSDTNEKKNRQKQSI